MSWIPLAVALLAFALGLVAGWALTRLTMRALPKQPKANRYEREPTEYAADTAAQLTHWTRPKDAAQQLGVHVKTIQNWHRLGLLDRRQTGRASLYRSSAAESVPTPKAKPKAAALPKPAPIPPATATDPRIAEMWRQLGTTANGHWHWARDLTMGYAGTAKASGYISLRDLWIGGHLERKEATPTGKSKRVYYRINKEAK